MVQQNSVKRLLTEIYGDPGRAAFERITALMDRMEKPAEKRAIPFSSADAVLITYGDSLRRNGQSPLATLRAFATEYLRTCFSAIHLLPFFPYSSDDGFSVIDFFDVNPAVGRWEDVAAIRSVFELMFDFVLNHVSSKSAWFNAYLGGVAGFEDLAIEVDPATDLTAVTRPRALPLLTPFQKHSGEDVHVWTTFSADQIDLNYKSITVLSKMVEVLLYYVEKGATIIRMDAVAYLWKEIGTRCIHLPQTHAVVKLLRMILDEVAPNVLIVTETNVPHTENISYFGNGYDEAQMVYNFTLPPMLLHAFISGDSRQFSAWASGLIAPTPAVTFFNFTASHDGIGVRPLEGILPAEEIRRLVDVVKRNGGKISYKQNEDGSQSPYELNITFVDALAPANRPGSPEHAARFLASQAIQLALPGVPGVYIHSLLGSRNWYEGVNQTGHNRSINREKLDANTLMADLADPDSFRGRIFAGYRHMLTVRRRQTAFFPHADCEVLSLDPRLFGLKRRSDEQTIFALTHIGGAAIELSLKPFGAKDHMVDLLTGRQMGGASVRLAAHETLWLSQSNRVERQISCH